MSSPTSGPNAGSRIRKTLVAWASYFLLCRKGIVIALSSQCHQPVTSFGPSTLWAQEWGLSSLDWPNKL